MSSEHPNASRQRTIHRIAVGALFVFAVAYGVVCVRHGRWDFNKPATVEEAQRTGKRFVTQGTDFTAYYSAGELALKRANIYAWRDSATPRRPFIYPPMFALFPMALLALFPHNVALALFYALNVISLVVSLWLIGKVLWPPNAPDSNTSIWRQSEFGLLITVAACWQFIASNTIEGNANLMVFVLIALGLYWDVRSHRLVEKNGGITAGILSGVMVALAAVTKLTPGLFGLFFLWSWRRLAMLGGALGLAIFLLFAPALWFGWDMNMKFLRAFAKNAAGKALPGTPKEAAAPGDDEIEIGWGKPKDGKPIQKPKGESDDDDGGDDSKYPPGEGVSFRGALTNLLTPAQAWKTKGGASRAVNIMSLEPAQARSAANVCSLLLMLATVALTCLPRFKRDERSIVLCWSLVTVAMVLVSPLTRIAHLVVLVLPVAALIGLLQQNSLSGWARKLAWGSLALVAIGSPVLSGLARAVPLFEAVRVMGFMTVVLVVLYVALAEALIVVGKDRKN